MFTLEMIKDSNNKLTTKDKNKKEEINRSKNVEVNFNLFIAFGYQRRETYLKTSVHHFFS